MVKYNNLGKGVTTFADELHKGMIEMEKYGLNQLREMFLEFFASKEHYVRKSFSLVPENDKSLLIINSGMAPLKPFFA